MFPSGNLQKLALSDFVAAPQCRKISIFPSSCGTAVPHQNPRAQVFDLAATVAEFEAKLASIPGIPELVPATIFLADGAPLIGLLLFVLSLFIA